MHRLYDASGALIESWDSTTRTYTDHRTGTTRPFTAAENAEADQAVEADARLTDLETRVARIEAHLWPADTDPQPSTAPTWDDLGGVWPAGTFLLDGVVYRNVSGVPLTTPPSGFPGSPDQWGHLFVVASEPVDPDPDPATPEWSPDGASYTAGYLVTFEGTTYRALQAHTSQPGWTPAAVPALWTPA